jgi:hypothetical protein
VKVTDPKIQKLGNGSFEQLDTADFIESGDYFICWKPSFIEYEGYIPASDDYWIVFDKIDISECQFLFVPLNVKMTEINISGVLTKFHEFQLFTGTPDCNSGNEHGIIRRRTNTVLETWIQETGYAKC